MAFLTYKQTAASKRATGSRKQQIFAITSDEPKIRLDGNWSGGSRHVYQIVSRSGRITPMPPGADSYYVRWNQSGPSIKDWPIPDGFAVLRTGTFRGRPSVPAIVGNYTVVQDILSRWGIDPNNPVNK
jgi:hypothetical protein